jgi:hypothetical protein
MERIDAKSHLTSLIGQTLWTATRRQPNRILRVTSDDVIVATPRSPSGQPVPIEWVQAAFDRLCAGEEVRISVPSLGYRSAFVGASMMSLSGTELISAPARVRLDRLPESDPGQGLELRARPPIDQLSVESSFPWPRGEPDLPACDKSRVPHIGVLFVHGVGYQLRGDTFRAATSPLIQLLREGTNAYGRAKDPTRFATTSASWNAQPFAEWEVGEGRTARHWVLTEAYWADSFAPPSFSDMVSWLAANNAASRVILRWRRRRSSKTDSSADASRSQDERVAPDSRPRATDSYSRFAEWLVSVGVYVLLIIYQLVRPVAALIPPVRSATVGRIDRAMLEWAGDMRVMLEDEVQAAMIRDRVARAAETLRRYGCREMVVIAHSGGVVASLMTINDPRYPLPRIRRYITLGQGVDIAWRILGVSSRTLPDQAVRAAGLIVTPTPAGLKWEDYWATHDLVPNGALEDPPPGVAAPELGDARSHRVDNTWSIVSDHGGYFDNDEQFLVPVARAISEASGVRAPLFGSAEQREREEAGRKRRRSRVAVRSIWGNIVTGASLVAIVGALGTGLIQFWSGRAEGLTRPMGEATTMLFEAWHSIPGTEVLTSPFRLLRDHEIWPLQLVGYVIWTSLLISLVLLHRLAWSQWRDAAAGESRITPLAAVAWVQAWALRATTVMLAAPTLFVIGLNSGESPVWKWFYRNTVLGGPIRDWLGPVIGAATGNLILFALAALIVLILGNVILVLARVWRFFFPRQTGDEPVVGGVIAVSGFLAAIAAAYTMIVTPEFLRYFVGWIIILIVFSMIGRFGYWRWARWDAQERREFRRRLADDKYLPRVERRLDRRVDFASFGILASGALLAAAGIALRPVSDAFALPMIGVALGLLFVTLVIAIVQDLVNERAWPLAQMIDWNPVPD